jgi:integrase/recombinase XerC
MPIKIKRVRRHFEVPPRRVFYTAEQIEEVLKYADPMQWLLIKLCFDAGLRISELANLRLREIDGRRLNYIGKGRKQRESYMSPETRDRLDDWIKKHKVSDFLWRNKKGNGALCTDSIRYIMRQPFRYAGFNDFYPHALRHSFATDLQRHGAGILESRDALGHHNSETTERYLHGLEGHLQNIFDKYKFGIDQEDVPPKSSVKHVDDDDVWGRLAEAFAAVAH